MSLVYDDRTNVLFLVVNADNDGLNTAKNFAEELAEYVHDLNNNWNCDKNGIAAAVEHLDEEYYAEHADMEFTLGAMAAPGPVLNMLNAKIEEYNNEDNDNIKADINPADKVVEPEDDIDLDALDDLANDDIEDAGD